MLNIFCGHRDELFTNDFVSLSFLMRTNGREYEKTPCVLMKKISAAHFHRFLFSIIIIGVRKRRKPFASFCPCFHITYCSLCLTHSQFHSKIKTMVHGDKIIKILPIDAVDCWLLRRYLFSQLQRPIAAAPTGYIPFPATVLRLQSQSTVLWL